MTIWSPEAICAYAHRPRNAPSAPVIDFRIMLSSFFLISNAQIFVKQPHLRIELGLFELFDDPATLHHIEPICQRSREPEVLLDQHHGEALRPEGADYITELLHDHRRKTL